MPCKGCLLGHALRGRATRCVAEKSTQRKAAPTNSSPVICVMPAKSASSSASSPPVLLGTFINHLCKYIYIYIYIYRPVAKGGVPLVPPPRGGGVAMPPTR